MTSILLSGYQAQSITYFPSQSQAFLPILKAYLAAKFSYHAMAYKTWKTTFSSFVPQVAIQKFDF